MTASIDLSDIAARIPELSQHIQAGEDVTIWANGVMVARLLPTTVNAQTPGLSSQNAAEAFAGRVGQISLEESPADLAANDEFYFAEMMADHKPSGQHHEGKFSQQSTEDCSA
jgi:antitoxin (DNA-binding transcriptional repressor) of toxin-antitoxin stability system